MKKTILTCIIIVLLTTFVGCGASTDDWFAYHGTHFEIEYPQDCKIEIEDDKLLIVSTSLDGSVPDDWVFISIEVLPHETYRNYYMLHLDSDLTRISGHLTYVAEQETESGGVNTTYLVIGNNEQEIYIYIADTVSATIQEILDTLVTLPLFDE